MKPKSKQLNGEQAVEEPRAVKPTQPQHPEHPELTGLYFISFEHGSVEWRGRVESAAGGLLLVQLFCWEDNAPLEKLLVSIDKTVWNDMPGILQSGWKFYSDRDSWEEASREEESDGQEKEA